MYQNTHLLKTVDNTIVSEPHTEILGGADMHVDWGSTINLTCVSKFSPVPPLDVIWYHNDKVIVALLFRESINYQR